MKMFLEVQSFDEIESKSEKEKKRLKKESLFSFIFVAKKTRRV
jgi:hypothetical protein